MAAAAESYKPQMIDFKDILFGPSSMKLLSLGSLKVLFVEDIHEPPKEKCGDHTDKTKWIDSVLDELFRKVNFPINFFLETTEFYKSYLYEFKKKPLFNDDNIGISKSINHFHNCVNITKKECEYLDTPVFFNNMETRRFEAPKKYIFDIGDLNYLNDEFDVNQNTLFDLPEIYLNKVIFDIQVGTEYINLDDLEEEQENIRNRLKNLPKYKHPMRNDLELDIILGVFKKHDSTFEYTKTDENAKDNLKKILKMLNLFNDRDTLKSFFSNLLDNSDPDDKFNKFKSMFSMFDETKGMVSDEKNSHVKFSKQLKTGIYDENIKKQILEYIDELCNEPEFKETITNAIKVCKQLEQIIHDEKHNYLKILSISTLIKRIGFIFSKIHPLIFDMYNIARFMRMYPFDESEFEFAVVYAGRAHTTNMIGFLTKYYDGRIIASINTNSDKDACIRFDTEEKIEFVRILDKILFKLQSKDIIKHDFFLEKKPRREDIRLEAIQKEIKELKENKPIGKKAYEAYLEKMINFHKYLSYYYRKDKRDKESSKKQIVAKPPLKIVYPPSSDDESKAPELIQLSTQTRPLPPLLIRDEESEVPELIQSQTRPLPSPSSTQTRSLLPLLIRDDESEDPSNLPGSVNSGGYKYNTSLYFNHCF